MIRVPGHLIAFVPLLAVGCMARARTPSSYTAASGARRCEAGGTAKPYVLDARADDRVDIQESIRAEALGAVVAYDCNTIRVLKGCHLASVYKFSGTDVQAESLDFRNGDEISLNLPLHGAAIATQYSDKASLHALSGLLPWALLS
jgi:hypothetical protein